MPISDDIKIAKLITDTYGQFSEEELAAIKKVMRVIKLNKNDVFVEIGKRNKLGLVITGSLYATYIDSQGNEKIDDIFYEKEKNFVFNYESYLLEKPLWVTIKANESCTMLVADVHQVKKLYEKYPRFYKIEMSIVQQHFLLAINRIKILQHNDPTSELKLLQSQLPNVFKHFSFSQIASYLGIHRNTFTAAMKKR